MNDQTAKVAIQEQFGKTAENYVHSITHANQPDLVEMVQRANLRGDERVLDIATGGGHTALAFAPHVAHVVATDLTPQMLAAAQRFIQSQNIENVEFEPADAEALPFEDQQFDVVTCRIAPHHFGDVAQFVAEVARVLRPGGRFILVDNVPPSDQELDQWVNAIEKQRDPTHARSYTAEEWQTLCSTAGFNIEYVTTWLKTIGFDDWCERAQVPPTIKMQLHQRFLEAEPGVREAFSVRIEGEQVRSFALHTMLMVAGK